MGVSDLVPTIETATPKDGDAAIRLVAPSRSGSSGTLSRDRSPLGEAAVDSQLRFRRALTAGYAMWAAFGFIDWAVVHNLQAGRLAYFLALRGLVVAGVLPILWRLYRTPAPSRQLVTAVLGPRVLPAGGNLDRAHVRRVSRSWPAPTANGLCLILLAARTITAQDPWRRGLVLASGVPVASYYLVLLGAALFFEHRLAAQAPRDPARHHDPAAQLGVHPGHVRSSSSWAATPCGPFAASCSRPAASAGTD